LWPKCRTRKPESLYLESDAALKRLEQIGDLFAPVMTLKQSLPELFEQAVAAQPPKNAVSQRSANMDENGFF